MGRSMRAGAISGFVAFVAVISMLAGESSGRIDAPVKGKQYKLTKQHGPWMIMVASFSEPPPERKAEGLTPEQAADELVFELRSKGIPAYSFRQSEVKSEFESMDRLGRKRQRGYTARHENIGVLAGNYSSATDSSAQQTLEWIKKFHPQFLRTVEQSGGFLQRLQNGGVYRKTPGRPSPLSGAFLTINPLLTPEEANARKQDPLIRKLNSDGEFSLLENQRKYTVVVASYHGNSLTQLADGHFREKESAFKVGGALDEAGLGAWQLASLLRQGNFNVTNPKIQGQKFEAWVFHDRYSSVVTIGGFDSAQDPRIAQIVELFGAKIKRDPTNGQNVQTAEMATLPGNAPGTLPSKTWLFDPQPRVIEVPRL